MVELQSRKQTARNCTHGKKFPNNDLIQSGLPVYNLCFAYVEKLLKYHKTYIKEEIYLNSLLFVPIRCLPFPTWPNTCMETLKQKKIQLSKHRETTNFKLLRYQKNTNLLIRSYQCKPSLLVILLAFYPRGTNMLLSVLDVHMAHKPTLRCKSNCQKHIQLNPEFW